MIRGRGEQFLPPDIAFFLDFDGTLVEIAEHPDAVVLQSSTRLALGRLDTVLEGAIAIVSGREIEDIDRLLAPLRLPVAGIHGSVRRSVSGTISRTLPAVPFVDTVAERLACLVGSSEGLVLERKSVSVALHYRARPELAATCHLAMERAIEGLEGVEVLGGRMVVEARCAGADKGSAIRAFLAEPPFAGRLPVFAGDDVTDEDAFAAVNLLGGISIKIGEEPSVAAHRFAATANFLDWLDALAGSWCLKESS